MRKYTLCLILFLSILLTSCIPNRSHETATKKQDTSYLTPLPNHIPENNIFNPQGLIDKTTEDKIKELNNQWIKDPKPTQFVVFVLNEISTDTNLSQFATDLLTHVDTSKSYVILMIDKKNQRVSTRFSDALKDTLSITKRDKLTDDFRTYLKANLISKGILQYLSDLDHYVHLTEEEKLSEIKAEEEETKRIIQEHRQKSEEEKKQKEAEKQRQNQQFKDDMDLYVKFHILKNMLK